MKIYIEMTLIQILANVVFLFSPYVCMCVFRDTVYTIRNG